MKQQAEAERYALLLDWGTRIGLIVLVFTFGGYLTGLLSPHVPLDQLPKAWSKPVGAYLMSTGTPTGWGWLSLALKGDLSNLVGIAILAGCSVPPLVALIPLYLKRRDYTYAAICGLIVSVLLLAASGVLTSGH